MLRQGYVHDKRVEFDEEKEENAWDDSLEDFTSEEEEDLFKDLGL